METPGTVIETPRLRLRQLVDGDAPALVELDSDPEVLRYIVPKPEISLEAARNWIRSLEVNYYRSGSGFGFWAIEAREERAGQFVGWYHLRPVDGDMRVGEIGYRLRRDAWGKGYASEASVAVRDHAFGAMGVRRLVAHALPDNAASIRVMRKLGMTFAGTHLHPRAQCDVALYELVSPGRISPEGPG